MISLSGTQLLLMFGTVSALIVTVIVLIALRQDRDR